MKKLRILFVANTFPSPDLPAKGAFNYRAASQLSPYADILVVHLRAWRPGRKIVSRYEMDGLSVTVFSFPFTDRFSDRLTAWAIGLYRMVFYRSFREEINRCTAIHSVGASFAGVVGAYAARRSGRRHVAQFIGSDINFVLPKLDGYWPVKNWHQSVDMGCCNSEELKRVVTARYPGCQVTVIYRGVDLKEFPYVDRRTDEAVQLKFLYLGGLSPRKGNPHGRNLKGGVTVLRSWKNAIDSCAEQHKHSRLFFGGPDVCESEVRSILEAEPSDYGIELIGYVDKFLVKETMQRAHIVIVASMAEGLPNVAMEAAASGCVVIGTRVGGVPEVIDDQRTGFLVDAANENQLRDTILRILENPSLLSHMSLAARRKMELAFDARKFAPAYLNAYSAIQGEQ